MKIILIAGVIGSGKDYWAEQYKKEHPTENIVHLRFAESLRDICEGMFSIPTNDDKAYTDWKNIPQNRQFMVDLGQNLKRVYGNDFFAMSVLRKINQLRLTSTYTSNDYTILITDFRFPVEFWTLANYFDTNKPEITVVFKDYHSYRYKLIPEQSSEQMAIWLLERGYKDNDVIREDNFARLLTIRELQN